MDARAEIAPSTDGKDWNTDSTLPALARLFPDDPRVEVEIERGWVAASTFHAARAVDLAQPIDLTLSTPGALQTVVEETFDLINGTAVLLLGETIRPIRWSGGVSAASWGTTSFTYTVHPRIDLHSLNSDSATHVLGATVQMPALTSALVLLGRRESRMAWFDLWAVWDILKEAKSGHDFLAWVGDPQAIVDFQYSANNVTASGDDYARHQNTRLPETYTPHAKQLAAEDARSWMRGLVQRWVEEQTGVALHLGQILP